MNERSLQIISRQIRIHNEIEECYKYYDAIRDFIISQLRKDRLFKFLFCGIELSGSCADGVKINKPDEFDCYVYLDFSKLSGIKFVEGNQPGTAYVNMFDCCSETGHRHFKDKILDFTSRNWNLLPHRINSWIQGLIAKVISKHSESELSLYGRPCSISLAQHGPAQTIFVKGSKNFSIDFVPSIKVNYQENWISDREPVIFDAEDSYWNLVSKPIDHDPAAFKASYTKMESDNIYDKNQFKNVLRLLKKVRDKNQLTPLKSYFIKTVCLWVDEEQEEDEFLWEQPIYDVLLKVLQELIMYCEDGNLPGFWDQSENLFSQIDEHQMDNILDGLHGELRRLMNGRFLQ